MGDVSVVSGDTARFAEATEAGHLDRFVTGVPTGWVPEFDVFNPTTGRQLAKGWRTVLRELLRRDLTTRERIQRHFGVWLNESDYDRLSFDEKRAAALSSVESGADRLKRLNFERDYAHVRRRFGT